MEQNQPQKPVYSSTPVVPPTPQAIPQESTTQKVLRKGGVALALIGMVTSFMSIFRSIFSKR